MMGRVCARPASIRTARLLNKATGAAFLLEHLTRSASICLVLIIIDKLQGIMCGAEGAAPAPSCPCSPRPGRCSAGDLCPGSGGTPGLFPPGNVSSSPALPEHFQLWRTGGNGEELVVTHWWLLWLQGPCCLVVLSKGMLWLSHTFQFMFAGHRWEVRAVMSLSRPARSSSPATSPVSAPGCREHEEKWFSSAVTPSGGWERGRKDQSVPGAGQGHCELCQGSSAGGI